MLKTTINGLTTSFEDSGGSFPERTAMNRFLAMLPLVVMGWICAAMVPIGGAVAYSAEIKGMATVGAKSALDELVPAFERASGNKVVMVYDVAAVLKKRVLDGETADLLLLTRSALEDLQKQNKLMPGSLTNVAHTPMSMAVRADAPKPDISSVEALKRTLLAARSITYPDPAIGAASGVYFAHVLDRLGLTEAVRTKTVLANPQMGSPATVLIKGDAELAVTEASGLAPVSGVQLVGPLPGEFAFAVTLAAGVGADSTSPKVAESFIQFFKGPASVPILKSKGLEPE
jgi:molybdate transport system substrate-binding protein